MKFHYIYKTTNTINGMFYIGKRTCSKPFDPDYYGSGTLIRRAVQKYGHAAFKVEKIAEAETLECLNQLERDIITSEVIEDPLCYNLIPGGSGGFYHLNRSENIKAVVQKRKLAIDSWSPTRRQEINSKKGHKGAENFWYGKDRSKEKNPFYGRRHSNETKQRLSEMKRGRPNLKARGRVVSEDTRALISENNTKTYLLTFSDGRQEIIKGLMAYIVKENLVKKNGELPTNTRIPSHYGIRVEKIHDK